MLKHLRISQFLGQVLLTKNQRELVKFMRQYTLHTKVPKSIRLDVAKDPFENLHEFQPKSDKIDKLLNTAILDDERFSHAAQAM